MMVCVEHDIKAAYKFYEVLDAIFEANSFEGFDMQEFLIKLHLAMLNNQK